MRYVVNAGFCDGKPRLMVLDAISGEVRMQWYLEKSPTRSPDPEEKFEKRAIPPGESHSMQSLLKNLFLIACSDDLDHSLDNNHTTTGTGSHSPANGEPGH